MGNLFSRSTGNLENRILNLENLDRNHDKVVSKAEFENWINELNAKLTANEQSHLETVQRLETKIQTLEAQKATLKAEKTALASDKHGLDIINQRLERKIQSLINAQTSTEGATTHRKLNMEESRIILAKYVEELLQNPEINIDYFPDFVERQIYRNVFDILLGLLDKVVDNTSINFLGHTIQMDLTPQS